ncbi:UTRA domain-containing protein, partial [Pseudooceanicola sp. GBMRC 2024]
THTVIRRRLSGDGVSLGAEMYLRADLLHIDDIELSELEGVNLRRYLEGVLGRQAQKPETRVSAAALSLRQAAMFDMTPDMPVLRIEASTRFQDGSPFYHQTIHAPAQQLILEF